MMVHTYVQTTYCYTSLLLGRSTTIIPQGPFSDNKNPADRYKFIQAVCNNFWKRWNREIFPSLVIHPKWHVQRRNVMVGDVVLLQDSNVVRGEWKMGIVSEVTTSKDCLINRVNVTYKRDSTKYTVSRAVQRLIVLVPKDEDENETVQGEHNNDSDDKGHKGNDDTDDDETDSNKKANN